MTRRQLLKLTAASAVATASPKVPAPASYRDGDWDVVPGAFSNTLDLAPFQFEHAAGLTIALSPVAHAYFREGAKPYADRVEQLKRELLGTWDKS